MKEKFETNNIIFSPEFFEKEKHFTIICILPLLSLGKSPKERKYLLTCFLKVRLKKIFLFYLRTQQKQKQRKVSSNTYLAIRVSLSNELDTYAEMNGLDEQQIIDAVGIDPQIEDHYNNPSFGYGGYCLPRDTKQLLAGFDGVSNSIITSIVDAIRHGKITLPAWLSTVDLTLWASTD